jgi:hypothetical protein
MAKILMIMSALIILILGNIHLIYTFRGNKFTPRDPDLLTRMNKISPVLTSETTMWKALIGLNASHSFGLILYGLVYGYLAIYKEEILFESAFLLIVGFAFLGAFVVLAKLFWFSVPFKGLCISFVFYAASVIFSMV